MADQFRITLAQLNPSVGALDANRAKAFAAWEQAREAGSDLVAFAECYISGYQLQDLAARPAFLRDLAEVLDGLARDTAIGPPILIGAPFAENGKIYNGYFLLQGGAVICIAQKHHLPNENVFDEKRVLASGAIAKPYQIGPLKIGFPICEDAWFEDVAALMVQNGAELFLIPNGSPYARGRHRIRHAHMTARVRESGIALIYLNLVGGQDDQVFDGGSFALNPDGKPALTLAPFAEEIAHLTLRKAASGWCIAPQADQPAEIEALYDDFERDYYAMVLGLRDYVEKSGFQRALLGLSGGIDSALVAVIAADALGPENLRAVRLASQYTSQASLSDAQNLVNALGCGLDDVPITKPVATLTEALGQCFAGQKSGLAEENIQSRLRGLILMALSNKFGEMVLTTGNKSELAVGYATIYGDMAGGYNPIKDLYKTRVFAIARWRGGVHRDWMKAPRGALIPEQILQKAPSAELRPNQRDDDSLPPYEFLDPILEGLIEREMSVAELVAEGFERDVVLKIQALIFTSEYKRFQSAPGPRLSERAFWLDRRYPIVNHWRDLSG